MFRNCLNILGNICYKQQTCEYSCSKSSTEICLQFFKGKLETTYLLIIDVVYSKNVSQLYKIPSYLPIRNNYSVCRLFTPLD